VAAVLAGAMLTSLAVAGCSALKGPEVPLDASAGMFDRASIGYRVETARINTALRSPPSSEGQLVAYRPTHSAALPADSVASVQIKYPHPQKKAGYAQVVVRIDDAASAAGWTWKHWLAIAGGYTYVSEAQEVWTLDIPQRELSQIVNRLQTSGYFQQYETADAATFETELDGVAFNKSWRQLPELDALIVRVRTEGRLISSIKAPGAADLLQPPAASVVAYREMLAEDSGVAFASDQPAAAPLAAEGVMPRIVRLPAVDARY
jgi:hypothetical protein